MHGDNIMFTTLANEYPGKSGLIAFMSRENPTEYRNQSKYRGFVKILDTHKVNE